MNFKYLCEHKALYMGDNELIVGERGPVPKAVSSFPELTCHSLKDLEILNSRQMQAYSVSDEDMCLYRDCIIPYWQGRSMRDKAWARMPEKWLQLYEAGLFTEFGEQRAFGHTSLDSNN
jgi:formate C-acetyltransferase